MSLEKNKKRLQIGFGVPYFNIFDEYDNKSEVSVFGNVNIIAKNYKKFLKRNGYSDYSLDTFEREIKSAVIPCVKQAVANAPKRFKLSCQKIEQKTEQIANEIKRDLSGILKKRYKVKLINIEILSINCIEI